jgi:hypothetical protein
VQRGFFMPATMENNMSDHEEPPFDDDEIWKEVAIHPRLLESLWQMTEARGYDLSIASYYCGLNKNNEVISKNFIFVIEPKKRGGHV